MMTASKTTALKSWKPAHLAVLATCFAALALGACRREEPVQYVPMKLGGAVQVDTQKDIQK